MAANEDVMNYAKLAQLPQAHQFWVETVDLKLCRDRYRSARDTRWRVDAHIEVGRVEVTDRLKLAGGADRHLMARGICISELVNDQRTARRSPSWRRGSTAAERQTGRRICCIGPKRAANAGRDDPGQDHRLVYLSLG